MKKWRDLVEEAVAGTFFVAGCALVVYGVIMRYVIHSPVFWVDEVSTYLLLWGTVLGWSLAEKAGRHIRVNLLYEFLSPRWRKGPDVFEKLISLGFCLFLLYASTVLVMKYAQTGQVSINAQIKLWIVYLVMPMAGLLLGARFLEELIQVIRNISTDGKGGDAR